MREFLLSLPPMVRLLIFVVLVSVAFYVVVNVLYYVFNKIEEMWQSCKKSDRHLEPKQQVKVSDVEKKIYRLLLENRGCQAKQLAESLNLSEISVRKYLKLMIDKRLVAKIGSRKSGKYVVVKRQK